MRELQSFIGHSIFFTESHPVPALLCSITRLEGLFGWFLCKRRWCEQTNPHFSASIKVQMKARLEERGDHQQATLPQTSASSPFWPHRHWGFSDDKKGNLNGFESGSFPRDRARSRWARRAEPRLLTCGAALFIKWPHLKS